MRVELLKEREIKESLDRQLSNEQKRRSEYLIPIYPYLLIKGKRTPLYKSFEYRIEIYTAKSANPPFDYGY